MKLGFIVNPIAGMGGKVGLKGTDGAEILRRARQLGAKPEAPLKASKALELLTPLRDSLKIITCPGEMGENEAVSAGFNPMVIGDRKNDTGPEDTERAARKMLEQGVDLLLFAGGDGTARNIYNAIGTKLPALGIPAGVKIHSAVYANHPRAAGQVALKYLQGELENLRESEVMDIDEEAFRQGFVTAELYGYLQVPHERQLVQSLKSGRAEGEEAALDAIADRIIEEMKPDVLYIVGSGTSIRPIMDKLGLPNTLLGIDLVKNQRLVANDVSEQEILNHLDGEKATIIVTIIGGQGYIFGRGNQQLSAEVIRKVGKRNIRIIATKNKIVSLTGQPLLVDTGDDEVNATFNDYMRIVTGYNEEMMYKVKGL
ncbi:MAG TPA: ATP-NAD kinase family protein [bacterium]|nr:ATP-NAD kinase family protein [bacterium]